MFENTISSWFLGIAFQGKMVDVCREKYGEMTANLTQSSEPYREDDGLQHPKKSGRT